MIADPLDRLRAANPLPRGSTAPPLPAMLDRVREAGAAPPRLERPGSRWLGAIVPALGVAAALAVAAAALLIGGAHRPVRSPVRTNPTAPSSPPVAPAGGMRGLVSVYGAAFPSPAAGVISLQQCVGCRNGNPTAHSYGRDWLALSADGGASWRVARRPWLVFEPRFSGRDGWAEGLRADSRGGGLALFYVTHDGGRSWRVAPSVAPPLGDEPVSVGGGEVWGIGSGCTSAGCTITILRAAAGADRLLAAPAQPLAHGSNNVHVVAAGPHIAYALDHDAAGGTFVTHDDGRTWSRVAGPCKAGEYGALAADGSSGSAWTACNPLRGAGSLWRSIDGGPWKHAGHSLAGSTLEPVSAQVAWAVTTGGAVIRTVDGGASWTTVWSPESEPPILRSRTPPIAAAASFTPMLVAQSPNRAAVVTILTRGRTAGQAKYTNLVVYRTTNAGATWTPQVVALP